MVAFLLHVSPLWLIYGIPDTHLHACTVNAGEHGTFKVVCGADNVKAGGKYPLALVGATVIETERDHVTVIGVATIKKGKLRVDFYDDYKDYLESRILNAGDVILLVSGGHGFKALEELEMIEVKQGPYAGDADKDRFEGIDDSEVKGIE